MAPFRLRLEWVGIEGRHVILDIELMQPVEVVEHESRAKTNCLPILEISIDPNRVFPEFSRRTKQSAVVSQVVHAYLETVLEQFLAQRRGHSIVSFRDEIEGGAEAHFHLELHQRTALFQTGFAFHVMRQNEGKFASSGPSRPSLGRDLGAGHDRPNFPNFLAQPPGQLPAKRRSQRPWNERL